MKLIQVRFDAFKSIVDQSLDIKDNCIGIVGTNESGKSNILQAISVLGEERKLSIQDVPKIAKERAPRVIFKFQLNPKDKELINNHLQTWRDKNTLVSSKLRLMSETLVLHIEYDRLNGIEQRRYEIGEIEMDSKALIFKMNEYGDAGLKIFHDGEFLPLSRAIIIPENLLASIEGDPDLQKELDSIESELHNKSEAVEAIEEQLSQLETQSEPVDPEKQTGAQNQGNEAPNKLISLTKKLDQLQAELQELKQKKLEISARHKEYNFADLIDRTEKLLSTKRQELISTEEQLTTTNARISELNASNITEPAQKAELTKKNKLQAELTSTIQNLKNDINSLESKFEYLSQPIANLFTTDPKELMEYLQKDFDSILSSLLPRVVFWENRQDYSIASSTDFSEIISKKDLNEISRPLVNLFRIGLDIETIDQLKAKIKELQEDDNERSRIGELMDTRINDYIHKIWSDYDQWIKVTVERQCIRIEVTDPKTKGASFYNMNERSQGAQTFISFLMTIGAEAEKGVIKDTILLLDEPETHLHPSGVRFMLRELQKIAKSGNIVLYATHSIFMIDKENYDRHIILQKDGEYTHILPSQMDRIGFFMQEEVLYSTLDVNLAKELNQTQQFNFVYEGDGDATLLEHYYNKVLKAKDRPFVLKHTKHYQGGKCSDIRKYLQQRPLQMNTKWVFILDDDDAGTSLQKFIESRYKSYLDTDVYVFLYAFSKQNSDSQTELEDLLPVSTIIEAVKNSLYGLGYPLSDDTKIKVTEGPKKEQIATICREFDFTEDKFIPVFKHHLNQCIKRSIKGLDSEEKFGKVFSDYNNWANNVIMHLAGKNQDSSPRD